MLWNQDTIQEFTLILTLSSIISSTCRKGTMSLKTSGRSKLKQLTVKSNPGQGKHIKMSFFQNILADGDCATHSRLKYVLIGKTEETGFGYN